MSAINDIGQIAGDLFYGSAFLDTDGAIQEFGVLPGFRSNKVTDLNLAGDIVGASFSPGGSSSNAFLYSNGTLANIGTGVANAINSRGVIVGTSGTRRASIYQDGVAVDLGDFGDSRLTQAIDVNDLGQIVGTSFVQTEGGSFVSHPFLFEGGVWRDLGLPAGVPLGRPSAINNAGQVIGNSNGSLGANNRPPFLYSEGEIFNLQTLLDSSGENFTLQLAYDINDAGVIIAQGRDQNYYQAVLLIPVPEPSTLASIAMIAGFVILIRNRG